MTSVLLARQDLSHVDLSHVPGQTPPPGVIPNFVNPVSRADKLIVANVLCLAFSLSFVALRIYTRAVLVKSLGIDDYLCLFATAVVIFYCSTTLTLTNFGLGKHQWDVPLSEILGGWLKWNVTSEIIYIFALMLIKMSILLLYRRMFHDKSGVKIGWVIDGTLFFVFGFSMACLFSIIFACSPIKKLWDATVPLTAGHCINAEALAVSHSALNIFTDFLILVIPIPVVWSLQLSVKMKLQLILIFATGAFVCGVSFVRLNIIIHGGANNFQPDATWARFENNLWSVIEVNFGLICACAPALKPFVLRVAPLISTAFSLGSSRSGGTGGSTNKNSKGSSRGNEGSSWPMESSDHLKTASMEEGHAGVSTTYHGDQWDESLPNSQQRSHITAGAAPELQGENGARQIHKKTQIDVTQS